MNPRPRTGLLPLLVKRLQACGLVTENLTLVSDHSHSKYMGVCLIRGSKHRRLDILVGPYSEWPFLLLHFTGSGYLNRSMRLIAQKKVRPFPRPPAPVPFIQP